ncbi:MAG: hypothetical protein ABS251_03110 [Wolbachia endosymbiont of Ephestia elutella]|uniref:Uncharacterized protein n=2 Tax=Wolbachia TaxID=953 RepID=A0AAU8MH49_9RICK|nr:MULTISPECIES: hypothetical protein [unclassified Wolbachia]
MSSALSSTLFTTFSVIISANSGESSFAENAACTAFLTKKHVASANTAVGT